MMQKESSVYLNEYVQPHWNNKSLTQLHFQNTKSSSTGHSFQSRENPSRLNINQEGNSIKSDYNKLNKLSSQPPTRNANASGQYPFFY